MIARHIVSAEEFDGLTGLISSLADDYKEDLDCFVGAKEHGYSAAFLYGNLLISKGSFERALEGLQQTSVLFPLIGKTNGKWLQFYVQKEQYAHQLDRFLRACTQDETLQQKIKASADEVDANITAAKHRDFMRIDPGADVDGPNLIRVMATIDDLRLLLDERKNLGLQYIFNLRRDQKELEAVFAEIEKLFWENLPILRRFRSTLKEHREAFLILDDKRYPWWYPEKRKAKAKTSPEAEDGTNLLKSKVA
jgi:hypothetical protein